MKLIRDVPIGFRLVAFGVGLFGDRMYFYKYRHKKVVKICNDSYFYKVYIGDDCF